MSPDDTQPSPISVSTPPPDILREERAVVAYTSYWTALSPASSLSWDKVGEPVREAWRCAADAAVAYGVK